MVRANLRLRMKAARLANHPATLDMAKLKTAALRNLHLYLRSRVEGLRLDEDALKKDD